MSIALDGRASSNRAQALAWSVWIAVAVAMSAFFLAGDRHSVTPAYRDASHNWFDGKPIYSMRGSGFIYHPQAALVFAPWGFLPFSIGEILWRWSIVAAFAAGTARLTRMVNGDNRWFLINSIVSAVMAVGCVRNGQTTLMISGFMMLACADINERRWTRAAGLLVLAFAFKPTSLILILLAGALFPPLLWRLALGLGFLAIAPFLTQNPAYVVSQFRACAENSKIAFSLGETGYWAQLFGIFKVAGFIVPEHVQQLLRVVFGLATLAACGLAIRKLATDRGVFYLFAISTCYLMLFNSRTEGCTYAMVAPVYGILLADAWLHQRRPMAIAGLIAAVVASAFSYDLIHLFTRQKNAEVWLCPAVCVLVTIYLFVQFARELNSRRVVDQGPMAS